MKTRFSDYRKDTLEKNEKEEDEKEKDCLLYNKISKLTIVKRRKNEHLKNLTISNPAKKLTIITILFSKKKL